MEQLYVVIKPKSENSGKIVRIIEECKNGETVKCQKRNGTKFYIKKSQLSPAISDNIINNLTFNEIIGTGIRSKIIKFFLDKSAKNFKFDLDE